MDWIIIGAAVIVVLELGAISASLGHIHDSLEDIATELRTLDVEPGEELASIAQELAGIHAALTMPPKNIHLTDR